MKNCKTESFREFLIELQTAHVQNIILSKLTAVHERNQIKYNQLKNLKAMYCLLSHYNSQTGNKNCFKKIS